MKNIVVLLLVFLLIGCSIDNIEELPCEDEVNKTIEVCKPPFQGPVMEKANEKEFRKTGKS